MAKKEKRFEIQSVNGAFENVQIIVDKKTGVNYLYYGYGYGGGLTPLLNRDGSVVVTTVQKAYGE